MRTIVTVSICLLTNTLCACSSSDTKQAAASTQTQTPAPDGGTPEGVSLTWSVTKSSSNAVAEGIPDAMVCVLDHSEFPCAKTDAEGKFTLKGLPKATALDLDVEATGRMKTLKTIVTSSTDMDGTGFGSIQTYPENVDTTGWGTKLDPSKGIIQFFATGLTSDGGFGPIPGLAMSLTPDSGSKPLYAGANGWDTTLTETVGFGGQFMNVPEGTYTMKVTTAPAGTDCEGISYPFSGWGMPAPTGEHGTTVHVRPGYLTTGVATFCTQTSTQVDGGDGG